MILLDVTPTITPGLIIIICSLCDNGLVNFHIMLLLAIAYSLQLMRRPRPRCLFHESSRKDCGRIMPRCGKGVVCLQKYSEERGANTENRQDLHYLGYYYLSFRTERERLAKEIIIIIIIILSPRSL